jgi:hypothetical protein
VWIGFHFACSLLYLAGRNERTSEKHTGLNSSLVPPTFQLGGLG